MASLMRRPACDAARLPAMRRARPLLRRPQRWLSAGQAENAAAIARTQAVPSSIAPTTSDRKCTPRARREKPMAAMPTAARHRADPPGGSDAWAEDEPRGRRNRWSPPACARSGTTSRRRWPPDREDRAGPGDEVLDQLAEQRLPAPVTATKAASRQRWTTSNQPNSGDQDEPPHAWRPDRADHLHRLGEAGCGERRAMQRGSRRADRGRRRSRACRDEQGQCEVQPRRTPARPRRARREPAGAATATRCGFRPWQSRRRYPGRLAGKRATASSRIGLRCGKTAK